MPEADNAPAAVHTVKEPPVPASEWLSPQTVVSKNKSVVVKKKGGLRLLIEPDSASWAVLPEKYFDFWRRISPVSTWENICKIEHGFSTAKRSSFLLEMFRRNMIAANGRLYYNPDEVFPEPETYPGFICFHVTEACNLACRYCMADSIPSKKSMPVETLKLFVEHTLRDLPNKSICLDFHGGEPLLGFHNILKAVEFAEDINKRENLGKDLSYCIQTNATLLTKENIEKLLKINNLRIGVSIDGPRQVHDKNRIFAGETERGSFDTVITNFKLARKMGLHPGALGVIHDPKDFITSFDFFVNELDMKDFRLNYSSYIGRSTRTLDFPLTRAAIFGEAWLELVDHAYACAKEHNTRITVSDIDNQINNLVCKSRPFMCYKSPCGVANAILGYAIDGGIHACEEMASSGVLRLGSIFDDNVNIKTLLDTSEEAAKLKKRTVENIPKCSRCAWRHFCGGGCTSKTIAFFGDYMRESPMCGYYPKTFEGLMWRLYEHPDMVYYLGGNALDRCRFVPFAAGD